MSLRLWFCIPIYAAAMFAISLAAHKIVGGFGAPAGMAVIAAMFGAAWLHDRRR